MIREPPEGAQRLLDPLLVGCPTLNHHRIAHNRASAIVQGGKFQLQPTRVFRQKQRPTRSADCQCHVCHLKLPPRPQRPDEEVSTTTIRSNGRHNSSFKAPFRSGKPLANQPASLTIRFEISS